MPKLEDIPHSTLWRALTALAAVLGAITNRWQPYAVAGICALLSISAAIDQAAWYEDEQ